MHGKKGLNPFINGDQAQDQDLLFQFFVVEKIFSDAKNLLRDT